jgi:hypothetical protein
MTGASAACQHPTRASIAARHGSEVPCYVRFDGNRSTAASNWNPTPANPMRTGRHGQEAATAPDVA